MAEKLNEYDFSGRGRPGKYPWGEWLDGGIYRLTKDEDFDCQAISLRQYVYKKAAERNLVVTTQIEDCESIVIQAIL